MISGRCSSCKKNFNSCNSYTQKYLRRASNSRILQYLLSNPDVARVIYMSSKNQQSQTFFKGFTRFFKCIIFQKRWLLRALAMDRVYIWSSSSDFCQKECWTPISFCRLDAFPRVSTFKTCEFPTAENASSQENAIWKMVFLYTKSMGGYLVACSLQICDIWARHTYAKQNSNLYWTNLYNWSICKHLTL